MSGLRQIACLAGLTAAVTVAAAQTPAPPQEPLYRIEIIIFAHNQGNPGDEDFRHGADALLTGPPPRQLSLPEIEVDSLFDFGLPAPPVDAAVAPGSAAAEPVPPAADSLELIERTGVGGSAAADRAVALPGNFRLLASDELLLTAVRRQMASIGARPYTILAHTGWVQSGVDSERSVPLDLNLLGITNPGGTIRLYLGRFLHVAVDLRYRTGSGSFWNWPAGNELGPLVYADSYELATERNAIRREELHYIDHPMFGVLIQILAAPEPATASSGQRGPAG
jgi:hypothetical protein